MAYRNEEGERVKNPYLGVRLDTARAISTKGDSGAPIHQPVSGQDSAWAVGVHVASIDSTSNTIIFQSVIEIEDELGLKIQTQ